MKTDNSIVGISFSETDKFLCQYVDFLATKIPINTVNNLYLFTARNLFMDLQRATNDKAGKLLLKSFEGKMEKDIKNLYPHIKNVNYYAKPGSFVSTFQRFLQNIKTDLVFIGKGKDSQGAMAKLTVSHIPAHVMIVPEGAQHKLNRILVVMDESGFSKTVLHSTLEISSKINPRPEITCLYISHLSYFIKLENAINEGYQMLKNEELDWNSQKIFEKEKADFEKFVSDYSSDFDMKVTAKAVFEARPKPYLALMDYLNENETDLLVMSDRNHSGLNTHILGRFTEKIITVNKKVPMLVVK
ncbi:MAG TPA: universal stress protein [Bacteroidetes bacterium]|nr:universal stress protein [Bacteroidota bacterium]